MAWIKNWFSNFKEMEHPIQAQGIIYWTVENFFQAMKTKDRAEREKIAAMSPGQAKRYCGRRNKAFKLREDWEDIKLKVMEWALRKKFQPGTQDYEKLMATGDDPIIENNNWHDNYWGDCLCSRCKDTKPDEEGKPGIYIKGKNHLGKLLMKIRDEYKNS